MDSDLEVLEEVTNRRNGDAKGGEGLIVSSGEQPIFGAGVPHKPPTKGKPLDPVILAAQRRNQEALARLRAAAEESDSGEEDLSEPESPGKFARLEPTDCLFCVCDCS